MKHCWSMCKWVLICLAVSVVLVWNAFDKWFLLQYYARGYIFQQHYSYQEILSRNCLPFSANGNPSHYYITCIFLMKHVFVEWFVIHRCSIKSSWNIGVYRNKFFNKNTIWLSYIRWINGLLLAESHLAVSIDQPNALHLNSTNITVCLQYTLYPESIHQQKNSPFLQP